MAIHDFDMARWLLGEEPVEIYAAGACLIDPAIAAAGDIDTAKTVLRTASGKLCLISNSRRSGYGDRKSTRLNPVTNAHLVCRLLLEKKKYKQHTLHIDIYIVVRHNNTHTYKYHITRQ